MVCTWELDCLDVVDDSNFRFILDCLDVVDDSNFRFIQVDWLKILNEFLVHIVVSIKWTYLHAFDKELSIYLG